MLNLVVHVVNSRLCRLMIAESCIIEKKYVMHLEPVLNFSLFFQKASRSIKYFVTNKLHSAARASANVNYSLMRCDLEPNCKPSTNTGWRKIS